MEENTEEVLFSVMLDGAPYVVNDGLLAYAYDLDGIISINGIGNLDANETVAISLPAGFTLGTYTMDTESEAYATAIIDGISYSTKLPGSIGQVMITKFDGSIVEGTFEFTATGGDQLQHKLVATEGTFNVILR
ncbi:MAG: DUF6252 family protein [Bacteroidota bacterium]